MTTISGQEAHSLKWSAGWSARSSAGERDRKGHAAKGASRPATASSAACANEAAVMTQRQQTAGQVSATASTSARSGRHRPAAKWGPSLGATRLGRGRSGAMELRWPSGEPLSIMSRSPLCEPQHTPPAGRTKRVRARLSNDFPSRGWRAQEPADGVSERQGAAMVGRKWGSTWLGNRLRNRWPSSPVWWPRAMGSLSRVARSNRCQDQLRLERCSWIRLVRCVANNCASAVRPA